ncbi:MAG TPA: helix-turn-helix transcriptional regulator [Thermoanaerobaculia bacterium]
MRELRQKRGLTQADLSERSGYAQGRISEIERGERVPTLNTMIRLARALECKPTALISPFDKADLSALALK